MIWPGIWSAACRMCGLWKMPGSTMSRYYVVDSLCCPSRAAIFTGEYPHDDGVFTNTGSDGGYAAYNRKAIPRSRSRLPCRDPATAPR